MKPQDTLPRTLEHAANVSSAALVAGLIGYLIVGPVAGLVLTVAVAAPSIIGAAVDAVKNSNSGDRKTQRAHEAR